MCPSPPSSCPGPGGDVGAHPGGRDSSPGGSRPQQTWPGVRSHRDARRRTRRIHRFCARAVETQGTGEPPGCERKPAAAPGCQGGSPGGGPAADWAHRWLPSTQRCRRHPQAARAPAREGGRRPIPGRVFELTWVLLSPNTRYIHAISLKAPKVLELAKWVGLLNMTLLSFLLACYE